MYDACTIGGCNFINQSLPTPMDFSLSNNTLPVLSSWCGNVMAGPVAQEPPQGNGELSGMMNETLEAPLPNNNSNEESVEIFTRQLMLYENLYNDSLLSDTTALTFLAQNQQSYLDYITQLEQLLNQGFAADTTSDTLTAALWASANAINSSLISNFDVVLYIQQVNQLYMQYLEQGGHIDYTQQDIELLQTIANLCPRIDGPAVLNARLLLEVIDLRQDYNDDELCSGSSRQANNTTQQDIAALIEALNSNININIDTKKTPIATQGFKLYPNPSQGQISLEWPQAQAIQSLSIVDAIGRQVWQQSYTQPQALYTINLPAKLQGMYICKALLANGSTQQQYFVVQP
jgi:hypothetical protein